MNRCSEGVSCAVHQRRTVVPPTSLNDKSNSLPPGPAHEPTRTYERLIKEGPTTSARPNNLPIQYNKNGNFLFDDGAVKKRPMKKVPPMGRSDKEEVIVVRSENARSPPQRSQTWNGKHGRLDVGWGKVESGSADSPNARKSGQDGLPNQTRQPEPINQIESCHVESPQISMDPGTGNDYTNFPQTVESHEAPINGTSSYPSTVSNPGGTTFLFPSRETDGVCATPALSPGSPQTPKQEAWMADLQNFTVESLHENLLKIGVKPEKVDVFRQIFVDGELFSNMTDKMLKETSPDLNEFDLLRLKMFRDKGKLPKTSQGSSP
ncbi:uncharacterized protein LOC135479166 isoform X2 [Liolophura sinensis]|uniref:uncharacterized protein LOC135479166 isoform X2 n=1 Tax=Liolophura sinensis TaxID=3198878 RepID=UPI003158F285